MPLPLSHDDCAYLAHCITPDPPLARELPLHEMHDPRFRLDADAAVMRTLGSDDADAGVGVVQAGPERIGWFVTWPGGRVDYTLSVRNAHVAQNAGATVHVALRGPVVPRGSVL